MPSSRASSSPAALVTLALVGSVGAPWLAWVALAADLLLVAAFLVDRARAARTPLRAERTWPPLLVQGASSPVTLRLEAPGPRGAIAGRARSAPPRARRSAPARAAAGAARAAPASGGTRWRAAGAARTRCRPLTVRVLGPWGLAWSQRTLLEPQAARVYPQVRWQGEVGQLLALAHRRELGRSPLRLSGIGSEPYALREYRPGDPPAAHPLEGRARGTTASSRARTRGSAARASSSCSTAARAMAAQDGGRSKLDHALAAALALTRVAASRGDRVTVSAFSDRVERTVRVRGGSRSVGRRLRRALRPGGAAGRARLRPRGRARAARRSRAAPSSCSSPPSPTWPRPSCCARRCWACAASIGPILVNLEDPELAALARGTPDTRGGRRSRKVSAMEILLANRRLGRRLQRSDIPVATAPADRLAWEALAVVPADAALGGARGALSRHAGRRTRAGGSGVRA